MTDDLPAELAGLPAPMIVEEISYDNSLADYLARLGAQFTAAGIDYDVTGLEANPGVVLMEVAAYRDVILRQRVNEAVQANLLPYASAADLDNLAAFYGVTRIAGEADSRLRERVVLSIRGRSTGGTEPRYEFIALSADARVADVAIYREGRDPSVHVAVFSTEDGGVADAALLAAVDAALQDPEVRMVNDTIMVESAAQTVVDIAANIWLLPDTAVSAVDDLASALKAKWIASAALGRDLTRSWITAQLHGDGVQRVDIVAPAADIIAPFNKAVAIGEVSVNLMGRDY